MPDILPPPPPENLNATPTEQGGLLKSQKLIQDIIIGIVIVLLLGLVGALIGLGAVIQNDLAAKQASYEDLKDQILIQNYKIDALTSALQYQTLKERK